MRASEGAGGLVMKWHREGWGAPLCAQGRSCCESRTAEASCTRSSCLRWLTGSWSVSGRLGADDRVAENGSA